MWDLPISRPHDQCMALSALGVLIHQDPKLTQSPESLLRLFNDLDTAYLERKNQNCINFFNLKILAKYNLTATYNFPTKVHDPEDALSTPLNWASNRKHGLWSALSLKTSPKNGAFIAILRRTGEDFQHAVTITCDGLWNKSGGFGFQDTRYDDGIAIRYWVKFDTRDALGIGFAAYLTEHDYRNATIQAVYIEKK